MLLYILLYILLAYLMLIAALSNAICIMLLFFSFFCHRFLQMLLIFMLCLGLLTHSLFISCIICIMQSAFNLLVFPNSIFTPLLLFFLMKGLCALRRNST